MMLMLMAAQMATASIADLSVFKPFIGACWRAELSPLTHDTHCFQAMYGRMHVRDRHEVRQKGKVVYSGETIYSLEGKSIVFTYYTSLGGIGRGTVTREGSTLTMKGSMRSTPADTPRPLISTWKIVDRDHYEVNTPPSRTRFTRVK